MLLVLIFCDVSIILYFVMFVKHYIVFPSLYSSIALVVSNFLKLRHNFFGLLVIYDNVLLQTLTISELILVLLRDLFR